MSNRVASASPCTSSGSGHTKYQTDSPTTAAITTPTIMDETRMNDDARSFDASCGCPDLTSVCVTGVRVFILASPLQPSENLILCVFDSQVFTISDQAPRAADFGSS